MLVFENVNRSTTRCNMLGYPILTSFFFRKSKLKRGNPVSKNPTFPFVFVNQWEGGSQDTCFTHLVFQIALSGASQIYISSLEAFFRHFVFNSSLWILMAREKLFRCVFFEIPFSIWEFRSFRNFVISKINFFEKKTNLCH